LNGVAFFAAWQQHGFGQDEDKLQWIVDWCKCPTCLRWVIRIGGTTGGGNYPVLYFARPRNAVRPIPADVVSPFSTDYGEACAVLELSPKASAALSRRLLQHILKEKGGAKKRDLIDQIDELLPKLPAHLQDLHAIRQIGNFAAHPSKDKNTGEIVEVEPGEAEWLLDIVERLFEHYFVQPAVRVKQLEELNKKLVAAGKPPLPI
jgi:hypothetical protein